MHYGSGLHAQDEKAGARPVSLHWAPEGLMVVVRQGSRDHMSGSSQLETTLETTRDIPSQFSAPS